MHLHPEVTHWVVLDDLDLCWDDDSIEMPDVMAAHFVQTDGDVGMTAQDAEEALRILAEPCKGPLPLPRRRGEVLDTPGTSDIVTLVDVASEAEQLIASAIAKCTVE